MTKKWQIWKEEGFEAIKGSKDWTAKDMLLYHNGKDDDSVLIGSFDSEQEAFEFFENEKKKCYSKYQDSLIHTLVLFDYLKLEEVECDVEDDIPINWELCDEYVAEI